METSSTPLAHVDGERPAPETGDASSCTERSDSTDTNEAAVKRGQLDAAFEELKTQVSRYETATGRSGSAYLGDQLDESETDPMANREMDLMKLCTRLIGHLAHCERDLAERTERLKIVDDEKRSLEAENEASRQHCEDLNDQVNTLQRELTALRASGSHSQARTEVALPTFAYESPSPRRAHREADLARISRRHELLARWQAASQ
ncbi:Hypothetical Protein FCC1311_084942 [Hondaea fermentalgiana]|uniref:Uncharacterized protein n=1 Tax=Hondaea fermentalgiana TaxID=2315210 RepID=A0A2R5GPN7_9STRA|nr:Hypothetical Protein FCC1311_084942 [Hondaea fermentalgiana]|eukprot:GBG32269.1 Hypothetical Protein FCC1311_084942 [Hondaea fermentalgiana]